MGSGASTVDRASLSDLFANKPIDGSDIKDYDSALAEIVNMRKLVKQYQAKLKEPAQVTAKKREAVMDRGGDKVDIGASYVPKVVPKSEAIRALLRGVVSTNILFSSYSSEEQAAIVDAFEPISATSGSYVIRQGTSGSVFYVVETGALDVYVKNSAGEDAKIGSPLGTGSHFGELALMYNTPRAASVLASSSCALWQIDRNTYRGIILHFRFIRNKQYIDLLKNVEINGKKLGAVMSEMELQKLTVSLQKEVYEMGEVICREGNVGDNFYIISQGEVTVRKLVAGRDEVVATLKEGDYFGEKALLQDDVRLATCFATTKVVCLSLGRDDFIGLMGTMEDVLASSSSSSAAGGPVAPGSPVLRRASELGQSQPSSPESRQAEVAGAAVEAESKTYSLSDFEIGRTLGCGAFGRVKVCKLKATGENFAIKCQSKADIVQNNLQAHVLNEMELMRKFNHPFIIRLLATMQDNSYIYFVTELLQGGELFTLLRKVRKLSESAARFYSASVIYAFIQLHSQSIAYRDLKPENIVLTETGYIKLIDLGLAKQLVNGKTYTLCGTPDYLAPEVILNEGHDIAVDYWALGIMMYEMLIGFPPFYANDPLDVYEKILSGDLKMHSSFSINFQDILKRLLNPKQARRLGSSKGGAAAVIKHKWFSSFDWRGLEAMTMSVPHVPELASKEDVSNFDIFEEGEMPALSDWNPVGV